MPLTRWNRYRQTRIQKRKALQLLTLSGVVRPSTNEPRYTVSPLKVAAIREKQAPPMIAQNILNTVQSKAHSRPRQTDLAVNRLQVSTRTWFKESLHGLRQLLHYDVGKAAGRVIGFPSAH